MKKQYENPSIEIAVISPCDVVCASGDGESTKGNNQNIGLNFGDQNWSDNDVD